MELATYSGAEELAALGRTFLATVLLVAGVAKLRNFLSFREVLQALAPRMQDPWIAGLAAVVVGLELMLAGALVAGFRVATWGATGFLCAATLALFLLRRREYEGGCACFGEHLAAGPVGQLDFARNAGLIVVSLAVSRIATPAPPLWAFSSEMVGLIAVTTASVLLSYATVVAMLAVRAARAGPVRAVLPQAGGQRP